LYVSNYLSQALGQLHRDDLKKVFRAAGTRSIVVKLLDTPLCDYLFANGKIISVERTVRFSLLCSIVDFRSIARVLFNAI